MEKQSSAGIAFAGIGVVIAGACLLLAWMPPNWYRRRFASDADSGDE